MEFNTYNSATSNIHNSQTSSNKVWKPIEVNKSLPCPHCGKPDWCYTFGDLSVCNRDYPPASGWRETSKTDQNGHSYYAPLDKTNKTLRPKQRRVWEYPDRHGNPLVRVIRIDDGNGGRPKRWQEKWDGRKWVKGIRGIKREHIPIYRYAEVSEAIAQNQTIYIVEGETCADALWKLGIPATTNIGGSKKWKPSDTDDLIAIKTSDSKHLTDSQLSSPSCSATDDSVNCQSSTSDSSNQLRELSIVLCPDRDVPGIQHTEMILQNFFEANIFPQIQWLYAFPQSPLWHNLPKSAGLDVVDWIEEFNLTATDIINSVELKRVLNYENKSSNTLENKSSKPQQSSSAKTQQSFSSSNSTDNESIKIKNPYTQMCINELYSDKPWIAIDGKLYEWNGKFYQKASCNDLQTRTPRPTNKTNLEPQYLQIKPPFDPHYGSFSLLVIN